MGKSCQTEKTGSWKTFKQVSASLLQIEKKNKNQQTNTVKQKPHETSPHHPSPNQFKCTQSAKQVVVYSEPSSSSNIHVQNKLAALVPMQELLTPSMHREQQGWARKKDKQATGCHTTKEHATGYRGARSYHQQDKQHPEMP